MNIVRSTLQPATTAASLALLMAVTADAASSRIQFFHDEGSAVAVDCGGFLALSTFSVDYEVITFFDDAGKPVKLQVHIEFDGALTNSNTGVRLRDPAYYTLFWDLEQSTTADVGLVYGITVPGFGTVVLDAGKLTWDVDDNLIFEAGPHQFLTGRESTVCAALT